MSRLMFIATSVRRAPSTLEVPLDRLTKLVRISIVQIANTLLGLTPVDSRMRLRGRATDAEDVGKPDLDLLVARKIHASNTSH